MARERKRKQKNSHRHGHKINGRAAIIHIFSMLFSTCVYIIFQFDFISLMGEHSADGGFGCSQPNTAPRAIAAMAGASILPHHIGAWCSAQPRLICVFLLFCSIQLKYKRWGCGGIGGVAQSSAVYITRAVSLDIM